MTLQVVFGTGPVGQAVMRELLHRGWQVRAVSRGGRATPTAGTEQLTGDASDPAFARQVCRGAEVVYNALNPPYHQWPELFPALQAAVIEGRRARAPGSSQWRTCMATVGLVGGR